MKKIDIRKHTNKELILLVYNDENLYKLRRNKYALVSTLDEFFLYDDIQMKLLLARINEES